MKPKAYSLSLDRVKSELRAMGHHADDSASLVMNLLYRNRHKSLRDFGHFSPKVQAHFESNFERELPKILKKQIAADGTVKLLVELEDGEAVESVIIPFYKKFTLCVSSQVGCAMNCSFCRTATQGFKRNLSAEEIIGQVMAAKEAVKEIPGEKRDICNVVFMGQGEPLHNFAALKEAIDILCEPYGLAIGRRAITVSTSGYLPGLKRFSELGGVNLALSLHSTKVEVRNRLIPINKRYPLQDVLAAIDEISLHPRQSVEYEYLLIKDVNDSREDAKELAELLATRKHLVNLIPFNPFPASTFQRPDPARAEEFKEWLVAEGIRCMIRKTKGDDILAACGQLKS